MEESHSTEIETLKGKLQELEAELEEKNTQVILLQDDLDGLQDAQDQSPTARTSFLLRNTKKALEEQEKLNHVNYLNHFIWHILADL